MTVQELIKALQDMQPNSPVKIDAGSYTWSIINVDPGDYGEVLIVCEFEG